MERRTLTEAGDSVHNLHLDVGAQLVCDGPHEAARGCDSGALGGDLHGSGASTPRLRLPCVRHGIGRQAVQQHSKDEAALDLHHTHGMCGHRHSSLCAPLRGTAQCDVSSCLLLVHLAFISISNRKYKRRLMHTTPSPLHGRRSAGTPGKACSSACH